MLKQPTLTLVIRHSDNEKGLVEMFVAIFSQKVFALEQKKDEIHSTVLLTPLS